MRSSRYASLTRLLIGASIIAGLFGTTASVALAASPATFGLLRQEDPHNGVQTTDTVYLSTDTITGTGDTATGFTVNLSSASPAHTASLAITAPTGAALAAPATYSNVDTTPTATLPGVVLTVDGTACAPTTKTGKLTISQLTFSGTDVTAANLMWEGFCPTLEIHLQVGIAATGAVHVVSTSPANTLAIGGVNVGGTSTAHSITYTNIGNTAVDMSSLAKGGRYPELYTFSKGDCGATLAMGASCTSTMVFKPVTYGLREGAVTMTGDDISADGLHKEVLVTATGVLPDATNISPATATDFSGATLPYINGVQLQTVLPTDGDASCTTTDNRNNAAIWYHFKSVSPKTLDLTTIDSDVATDIELYTGPVGAPVFVKCGVNIDANLRDQLTFDAAANVDYYIRVAREVPPPGDYAIVFKASLGTPDTTVNVTGFVVSHSTFYPVVDGFGDTVDIRANRLETASASISIYNPSGTRVRILTVPSGTGLYSVAWNGKNTAGTLQPAGKYKVVSTVTDVLGNHISDTRYVTISLKKLITKTFTKTLTAKTTASLVKTGTGTSSTASAYTGGLKLASGANGTVAAAYRFYPPSAISYTSVTFVAYGKGSTNYMMVGLQDWTLCTTYSTSCVAPTHSAPHSAALAGSGVSSPAAKAVYPTSTHSIRGYVFAPASPGVSRTLDLRNVKITVTYKVLG